MPITVPVSLTPAEEAALRARAKAEGVSADSLLHQAVVQLLSGAAAGGPELLTPEARSGKGSSASGSTVCPTFHAYPTRRSAERASTLVKTSGGRCFVSSTRMFCSAD